ncbi:MAG: hypothetical protein LWX56_11960 [Ignavibacteria bacterium]|nr:hypothetical protein [Ignavibacteria bacterium]
MTWEELYPILKVQAEYAILRYEEPMRRKDKIQELLCQAYELYKSYIERGKAIRKQDFKAFNTQRAKQVDMRSVCKKGMRGTSNIDVLGFYRRRPDSPTPVVEFDEWMTFNPKTKENVDATLCFQIDYQEWLKKLTALQRKILNLLIEGYKTAKIAEKLHITVQKARTGIFALRSSFVTFFHIQQKSLCLT